MIENDPQLDAQTTVIISTPGNDDVQQENSHYGFGCFETANIPHRSSQEDAMVWQVIKQDMSYLTPEDIGKRLWTSYKLVDESYKEFEKSNKIHKCGSTATTTVFDGKDNLITATLADSAAFVVVYNEQGNVKAVKRLNSVVHHPTDKKEIERIIKLGGVVIKGRVDSQVSSLAVSRALGDYGYLGRNKQKLICSDATIDILHLPTFLESQGINATSAIKIQVITACDGFTDAAGKNQSRQKHEAYLHDVLSSLNDGKPGQKSEAEIAKYLVTRAKEKSTDNISVSVQSLKEGTAVLLGVYDGHGGSAAAHYVAKHIGTEFLKQCAFGQEAYGWQELSTTAKNDIFIRDNPWAIPVKPNNEAQAKSILNFNQLKAQNYFFIFSYKTYEKKLIRVPTKLYDINLLPAITESEKEQHLFTDNDFIIPATDKRMIKAKLGKLYVEYSKHANNFIVKIQLIDKENHNLYVLLNLKKVNEGYLTLENILPIEYTNYSDGFSLNWALSSRQQEEFNHAYEIKQFLTKLMKGQDISAQERFNFECHCQKLFFNQPDLQDCYKQLQKSLSKLKPAQFKPELFDQQLSELTSSSSSLEVRKVRYVEELGKALQEKKLSMDDLKKLALYISNNPSHLLQERKGVGTFFNASSAQVDLVNKLMAMAFSEKQLLANAPEAGLENQAVSQAGRFW
ncbi:Protein phosphatase 2C [Legionella beliardensis]|uniref:protein-serine/threonine phosphatase n=1 Tax=Legionella beliardensis TaxID=91822 RepID=A0A378I594_9GAMM|nr:PP2C family protein-serine/threonine phosphatase [Legionella beliardensis]STX27664.1 Protein phosphatase 2C [Legionella beliardensis]